MAQELIKLGPPTVEFRGYSHDTSKHWKIVTDASVRGRNHHDLCLELVSPILQGSEGLDQLRVLMEHVRLHGGVEELREAEAWVRLVLRFCSRTPTADITPIQTLVEEATPAMELMALWKMVDCLGLEQFYVLDRKLFVPQQLQNHWLCKKCKRPFGNARALSQHVEATGHH